jgi:hypothetical protein
MSDIRTRFHPHSDGTFTIHRWQDAEPIIETNKVLQSLPQRTDGLKHIASIPALIYEQWVKETDGELMRMPSHEQAKFFRRKLNDPQWRFLLTTERL